MKTVTIELPDKVAIIFDAMSEKRKANAALLTACLAQGKPAVLDDIFARIDGKVAKSGISDKELDALLDEIS